ncbi:DUF4440 domain-containing protein [Occallatibacter riparius]|uniref:DUF4440 domain-containing protein n=1 Tax=Occallatibacter riparius TaxID=1002689 RepID=UPI0036F276D4
MWLALFLSAASHLSWASPADQNLATARDEIKAVRAALDAAASAHDKAAYERLLAPGFMFIHSTGATETREEYIARASRGALAFQRQVSPRVFFGRTDVRYGEPPARTESCRPQSVLHNANRFGKFLPSHWQYQSE